MIVELPYGMKRIVLAEDIYLFFNYAQFGPK
jgi:hypothetical protein